MLANNLPTLIVGPEVFSLAMAHPAERLTRLCPHQAEYTEIEVGSKWEMAWSNGAQHWSSHCKALVWLRPFLPRFHPTFIPLRPA